MTSRAVVVLIALAFSIPSFAYYHFTRYLNRNAPFNPVVWRYDFGSLPNKTLTFFVSDAGPAALASNDSPASLLAQIKEAVQVWDAVPTSDLRVAFGGVYTPGAFPNAPTAEIVFEDLPPGVLALGAPTARGDVMSGANGAFAPILRSTVQLRRDFSGTPAFRQSLFTTLVHEIGHALGLQHTFTSSAMSVTVTRATHRARPLDADDIAAISLLYPTPEFRASTGVITGRVTTGGQGIHLASVVAVQPNGSAVSALTLPDGTYRIEGLPAGAYVLYAHPLPPAAQAGLGPGDIVLPADPDARAVNAGPLFDTVFHPNTRNPNLATTVVVRAGQTTGPMDFAVNRRAAISIYDVSTYSSTVTRPAFLSSVPLNGVFVATGTGIATATGAAAGLTVLPVGGWAQGPLGVRAYNMPNTALALDYNLNILAGAGPRHLVFQTPAETYVLPAGVTLVQQPAPTVASVQPNPDGTVLVTGTGWQPDTRIFFDALPAVTRTFQGDAALGRIVAVPPPGANTQRATVWAVNADGQNSLTAAAQPSLTPEASNAPEALVSPAALPVNVEAMIEINVSNMRLVDGQVTVGFGTSDVYVRRVWVLSPTRLLANVLVSSALPPAPLTATVISGFQIATVPGAIQLQPSNPRLPLINPVVANAVPGGRAIVTGNNLQISGSPTVTINDIPAAITQASLNQVVFQIPTSITPGPAVLKLNNGLEAGLPIVIQVEPAQGSQSADPSGFE